MAYMCKILIHSHDIVTSSLYYVVLLFFFYFFPWLDVYFTLRIITIASCMHACGLGHTKNHPSPLLFPYLPLYPLCHRHVRSSMHTHALSNIKGNHPPPTYQPLPLGGFGDNGITGGTGEEEKARGRGCGIRYPPPPPSFLFPL